MKHQLFLSLLHPMGMSRRGQCPLSLDTPRTRERERVQTQFGMEEAPERKEKGGGNVDYRVN